MPRFAVGDFVERVSALAPSYMKFGKVLRVITHAGLPDYMTEYEVGFDDGMTGMFRQTELRLAAEQNSAEADKL
jgi:hypothetical protein